MSEHTTTAPPSTQEILDSAHRDLHSFAQIVDDLRRAISEAHGCLPGSRNADKARRILGTALDRSTTAVMRIERSPLYRDTPRSARLRHLSSRDRNQEEHDRG